VPDIRFKFLYSIFGSSNLKCELVSDAKGVLVVVFRAISRPSKPAQNCLTSAVQTSPKGTTTAGPIAR
jgi:hypothetical protein